jgi:hypothetical protein
VVPRGEAPAGWNRAQAASWLARRHGGSAPDGEGPPYCCRAKMRRFKRG